MTDRAITKLMIKAVDPISGQSVHACETEVPADQWEFMEENDRRQLCSGVLLGHLDIGWVETKKQST